MEKESKSNPLSAPELRERLLSLREIFLANLVLTSEVPAPTFGEQRRAEFLLQRFSEAGLPGVSLDEAGNAATELPGEKPDSHIVVVARLDGHHDISVDPSVSVLPDRLSGPGIADNATGLAAMISLPRILHTLGIRLRSTLVLLGAGRSLGRGNIEGLRFFLDHSERPVSAGLCLEGVELGRLNYKSLGLLRGEIRCRIPKEYDWTHFGSCGAIVCLNKMLNRMQAIPLPSRPRTEMILGQISGGSGYSHVAQSARLRFDVQSESADALNHVEQQIYMMADEVQNLTGLEVFLDVVAKRGTGEIPFEHPFVQKGRAVLAALDIEPKLGPTSSELSAFISRGIPALTIGLTHGENIGERNETVFIDPLFAGLAQTVALLQAIDREVCPDES